MILNIQKYNDDVPKKLIQNPVKWKLASDVYVQASQFAQ